MFDSDLNKLVLNSGRKLTDLEAAQVEKTQRAQELKVIRKTAMDNYKRQFNLLLRSKERNRKDIGYTATQEADLSNATEAIKRLKASHKKKQTPTSNNGHLDNIIRLTAAQQAANDEK